MYLLRTFGGLSLHQSGTALDRLNAQRKALALLAVLAAAGENEIGREKVMALLWPESDAVRARGALKQMLHSLRRQLPPDAILGTTELRLNPRSVESDIKRFLTALEVGDAGAAVAQYQGPFLDGVHLRDAPEFDLWLEQKRGELARSYQAALEKLAHQAEAIGDWQSAVTWWRRRQESDPLDGQIAIRLMTALAAQGDRAGAIAHARTHEALLREVWGLTPEPAVTELADRLRTEPRSSVVPRMGDPHQVDPAGEPEEEPSLRTPQRRYRYRGVSLVVGASLFLGGVAGLAALRNSSEALLPAFGELNEGHASSAVEEEIRRSVTVIPFQDISPGGDQAHFADGLAEELITRLSQLPELRVPARTSSFQFRDSNPNIGEVGRRLGVSHLLTGSVRRSGDRLRITVQLVSVESGYHLWAESYDRGIRDVFAVQDEISVAVVDALRLRLGAGSGRAEGPPTTNVEAYELYLRGRFFANRRTENDLVRAGEYFEQAIAADPRFASAYVGLADTHIAPRASAPTARFLRAYELVSTALALDSTLAAAHATMGWISMWYDRDWDAAERHLKRSLSLDPSYLWGHQWYSAYLAAVGRMEEALAAKLQGQHVDPLSVAYTTHIGTDLLWLGRHEEAVGRYEMALEVDPNFFMARWGLGRAYLELGRFDDAFRELQYPGTDYAGLFGPGLRGYAYGVAGREAEARALLADLHVRRDSGEYVAPTEFAAIHLGLGEQQQALDWVELHEHDRGARIFLASDPIFDPLRTEVRFQQLLVRLGLGEAARYGTLVMR